MLTAVFVMLQAMVCLRMAQDGGQLYGSMAQWNSAEAVGILNGSLLYLKSLLWELGGIHIKIIWVTRPCSVQQIGNQLKEGILLCYYTKCIFTLNLHLSRAIVQNNGCSLIIN